MDNLVLWDGFIKLDKVVNTMSPLPLSSCVLDPISFPQDSANLYGVFPEQIPNPILICSRIFYLIKQYDRYYSQYSRYYSDSDSDS